MLTTEQKDYIKSKSIFKMQGTDQDIYEELTEAGYAEFVENITNDEHRHYIAHRSIYEVGGRYFGAITRQTLGDVSMSDMDDRPDPKDIIEYKKVEVQSYQFQPIVLPQEGDEHTL